MCALNLNGFIAGHNILAGDPPTIIFKRKADAERDKFITPGRIVFWLTTVGQCVSSVTTR